MTMTPLSRSADDINQTVTASMADKVESNQWIQEQATHPPFRWYSWLLYLRKHALQWLVSSLILAVILSTFLLLPYRDQYISDTLFTLDILGPQGGSVSSQSGSSQAGQAKGLGLILSLYRPTFQKLKSSPVLMNSVFKQAAQANVLPPNVHSPAALASLLDGEIVKDTQFAHLSAKGATPQQAQKLLTIYLENYRNLQNQTDNDSSQQSVLLIEHKLASLDSEIQSQFRDIQAYQVKEGVLPDNAVSLFYLNRIESLMKNNDLIQSDATALISKQGRMRQQLGLPPNAAVETAMFAQSNNDSGELKALERQYKINHAQYTDAHPIQVQLRQRIEDLKAANILPQASLKGPTLSKANASDELASLVAGSLLDADANVASFPAALKPNINSIKLATQNLQTIVPKEVTLKQKVMTLEGLSDIRDNMRKVLEDYRLKEQFDSVTMLSPPSLSDTPVQPNRISRLLISLLLAALLPLLWFTFRFQRILNQSAGAEFIQKILNIPVLLVRQAGLRQIKATNTDTDTAISANDMLAIYRLAMVLRQNHASIHPAALSWIPTTNSIDCIAEERRWLYVLADILTRQGEPVFVADFFDALSQFQSASEQGIHLETYLKTAGQISDPIVQFTGPMDHSQMVTVLDSAAFHSWVHALQVDYSWVFFLLPHPGIFPAGYALMRQSGGVFLGVSPEISKSDLEAMLLQTHQAGLAISGSWVEEL